MKALDKLVWSFVLLCIAMFSWLSVQSYREFCPSDPTVFHTDTLKMLTPEVKIGDKVRFSIEVDKFGYYPADISTTLISKDRTRVYALNTESGALPPGHYHLTLEEIVPKHVEPGEYTLSRIYDYQVGRARVMKWYETPPFEVSK